MDFTVHIGLNRCEQNSLATSEAGSHHHQNTTLQFDKIAIAPPTARRRSRQSGQDDGVSERVQHSLPVSTDTLIADWIKHLPSSPKDFIDMALPPAIKRQRLMSDVSGELAPSATGVTCTSSQEDKWSQYTSSYYITEMESNGSFARDHPDGPLQEEIDLCNDLLTKNVPLPSDPLWTPHGISYLRSLLREKSELRVCVDLNPRLVPSSEILEFQYPGMFSTLVEGHNDKWVNATPFYRKLPQPDRTKAFNQTAFTEEERRKLGVTLSCVSWCSTRPGWLFPYFTCEVKCGKQGLDIADNANLNSTTIIQRNTFQLFRQAGNTETIHRRFLAFSISHNDGNVRIYGHYPYIQGDNITYWRRTLRDFSYCDKDAAELATAYTFIYNLDSIFAPSHLKRLRSAIDRLPVPTSSRVESYPSSSAGLSSPIQASALTLPLAKSNCNSGSHPLRPSTKADLVRQLEQQKHDFTRQLAEQQKQSKEQMAFLEKHMAEQQRQSKEQMAFLEKHMAEQQRQSKEQVAQQQRQIKEQMALLEELKECLKNR